MSSPESSMGGSSAAQSASSSPTATGRAHSVVAMNILMAITGLLMVLFLLAHMYGNLKAFQGQQAFDAYATHLRTMGEPILPRSGALDVIRAVMLVAVVCHFVAAFMLWRRNDQARGGVRRYRSHKAPRGMQRTYASFTLRWGGVVILTFVIYHLLNLTYGVIHPGGYATSPFRLMVDSFTVWWMVASYTIALLAVGFHLRHGVWSALAILGANVSLRARRNLNILAYIVSAVITIGFLIVPYSVVFGQVK